MMSYNKTGMNRIYSVETQVRVLKKGAEGARGNP